MRQAFSALLVFAALASFSPSSVASPLSIVAAENFYGDVAGQIAGGDARVSSILSNPDQDPHLFEADASTIRKVLAAKIVVASGAGYDLWMQKIVAANPSPGRIMIVVADLVRKTAGDNPHIWYDPATMKAFSARLARALETADPANASAYVSREKAFLSSMGAIDRKIASMRNRFSGTPIAASEPIFGYMAAALGLRMRDQGFQLAIQNDAEPSASQVAAFETDLIAGKVKALLFNSQASEPSVERLVDLARSRGVPVIGVTETEPAGTTYQKWMASQLQALDHALAEAHAAR